jgi:hypothetical protein
MASRVRLTPREAVLAERARESGGDGGATVDSAAIGGLDVSPGGFGLTDDAPVGMRK